MENQNDPLQETQSTPQPSPNKKSYLPVILIILGIIGIISSLSILYGIVYTINLFSGFPSDLFASILFYLVSIVPITIPVAQIIFGFRLRQTQNASKIISHRQKTIAILLILSSFVFALLFKILYVDFFTVSISNHNLPPPSISSPTQTPDPTANWKMYRNEEYGFEVKYPSVYEKYDEERRYPFCTPNFMRGVALFQIGDIMVDINENESISTFEFAESAREKFKQDSDFHNSNVISGKISTMGGKDAIHLIFEGNISSGDFVRDHKIYTKHGKRIFQFSYREDTLARCPLDESGFLKMTVQEYIPQILSALKFTDEKQPTSDSKYCNTTSDCGLLNCGGCFSKEFLKDAPPDLPCIRFPPDKYTCSCIENVCVVTDK